MLRFLKNKITLLALLLFGTGMFSCVGLAAARGADPGSTADPLVTRSFVEKYVQDYVRDNAGAEDVAGGPLAWSVLTLGEEQNKFIGKAGTEFIVRSGSAVIVDPSGSGIIDLTAGKNVMAGQPAENNHLYSIPRDDGRGISAQTKTVIIYRGY